MRIMIPALAPLAFLAVNLSGTTMISAEELDCVLKPSLRIDLTSSVPGVLDSVDVDRGARVSKGQVVARLQAGVEQARLELARARAEANAAVESAKAKLAYQRRRLQRNSELGQQKIISNTELDDVETEARVAELQLREATEAQRIAAVEVRAAEEMVKQRIVESPIAGAVVDRFRSPGEYVGEQEKILTLAQIDPLYVEAIVPVTLLGSIAVGANVDVRPEAPVGGVYTARVIVIDDVIDAASGTFRVRAELANPGERVPAGLRCKLTLAP